MAAYRRVYDSRRLQADCQEPGSATESYAGQSSMGYIYLLPFYQLRIRSKQVCWTSLQSGQNLRGPHVARQQQLAIDMRRPRPTSAANPTLLLSIDGTDEQTDGRTLDCFMTLAAYHVYCEMTVANGHFTAATDEGTIISGVCL